MERGQLGLKGIMRRTGLLGGVQGLYMLTSVLRNKFAAILLGAAGMGIADLYNRTAELMTNATNLGLPFTGMRRIAERKGKLKTVEAPSDAPLDARQRNSQAAVERLMARQVCLVRSWVAVGAALGILLTLAAAPWLSLLMFKTTDHTTAFRLLSPMVGFLTLTGGETALLKGLGLIRPLAKASAMQAVTTLVITVSCYWFFGLKGIGPALVVSSAAGLGLQLRHTLTRFPYRLRLSSWRWLRVGTAMLSLGVAYVAAAILMSLSEMTVRTYLARFTSLTELGVFGAGIALTVTYARLVFVAMDADFFPRLTAVKGQVAVANETINRQIVVCTLLMSPLLVVFVLILPWLIPLLYSADFLSIVPMIALGATGMFFKAIYTPVAYLPLAHGDSRTYLALEIIYDVLFALLLIAGHRLGGLTGAGIGLALAHGFDLVFLSAVYTRKYAFRFSRRVVALSLALFVPVAVAIALRLYLSA